MSIFHNYFASVFAALTIVFFCGANAFAEVKSEDEKAGKDSAISAPARTEFEEFLDVLNCVRKIRWVRTAIDIYRSENDDSNAYSLKLFKKNGSLPDECRCPLGKRREYVVTPHQKKGGPAIVTCPNHKSTLEQLEKRYNELTTKRWAAKYFRYEKNRINSALKAANNKDKAMEDEARKVPEYAEYSNIVGCELNRQIIKDAVENYRLEKGETKEITTFMLCEKGYLRTLLNCPAGGEDYVIEPPAEKGGKSIVRCPKHAMTREHYVKKIVSLEDNPRVKRCKIDLEKKRAEVEAELKKSGVKFDFDYEMKYEKFIAEVLPVPEPVESLANLSEYKSVNFTDADWSKFFKGFKCGTFALYNESTGKGYVYNRDRAELRVRPCSTFKIFNSLVGLETGVIADENFVIKWDGKKRDFGGKSWEGDKNMAEAIKNSVVWYYQELARRVGRERMENFIMVAGYGNMDISAPAIDSFWLSEGSLKISAFEQVDLLERLLHDQLPFSTRSVDIVKKIIILEDKGGTVFSGKTGSAAVNGRQTLGWFVGYVKKGDATYIFAANAEGDFDMKSPPLGSVVKGIAIEILKSLKIL